MDIGEAATAGHRRDPRIIPQYGGALQPESTPLLQLPTRSPSSSELQHITTLVKRPLSVRVNEYVEPSICLLPLAPKAIISKSASAVLSSSYLTSLAIDSGPASDATGSGRQVSDGVYRLADGLVNDNSNETKELLLRPQLRPGQALSNKHDGSSRDGDGSDGSDLLPAPSSPPPHPSLIGSSGNSRGSRPRSGMAESRNSGVTGLTDAVLVIISEQPRPVPPAGDRTRVDPSSSNSHAVRVDLTASRGGKARTVSEVAMQPTVASSIVCERCGKCQCHACTQTRNLPQWSIPAPRRLIAALAASPLVQKPAEQPFLPVEQQSTAAAEDTSLVCSDECCIDAASCLCCVRPMISSGCSSSSSSNRCCCCAGADWKVSNSITDGDPCACCSEPMCFGRWSLLLLLSATVLPCLCLYWPLRGCTTAVSGCYNCYRKRHGCRCESGQAARQGPIRLNSGLSSR